MAGICKELVDPGEREEEKGRTEPNMTVVRATFAPVPEPCENHSAPEAPRKNESTLTDKAGRGATGT